MSTSVHPGRHMPIRSAHGLPLLQPPRLTAQWRPLLSPGSSWAASRSNTGSAPFAAPVSSAGDGLPAAYRVSPATGLGGSSRGSGRWVARRPGGEAFGSVAARTGAPWSKPFLWFEVQLGGLHHGIDLKDAKPDMGRFSRLRDRPVNVHWPELVGFPWFDSCFYNGVPGSGG